MFVIHSLQHECVLKQHRQHVNINSTIIAIHSYCLSLTRAHFWKYDIHIYKKYFLKLHTVMHNIVLWAHCDVTSAPGCLVLMVHYTLRQSELCSPDLIALASGSLYIARDLWEMKIPGEKNNPVLDSVGNQ